MLPICFLCTALCTIVLASYCHSISDQVEKQLPIAATHRGRQAAEFKCTEINISAQDLKSSPFGSNRSDQVFASRLKFTDIYLNYISPKQQQEQTQAINHLSRQKQITDIVLRGTDLFV